MSVKAEYRIPKEGAFTAWKKCVLRDKHGFIKYGQQGKKYAIVKLRVPAKAKRRQRLTQNYGAKARVSEATVVGIWAVKRNKVGDHERGRPLKRAWADYTSSFVYPLGDTLRVPYFDPSTLICAAGIHCFATEKQALNHYL